MEIGQFNQRLIIQTMTEIQEVDGAGTYKTFTTVYTVWAKITPVKGYVTFDTKQIGTGITHHIVIRYNQYITSENWILYRDRRFRIRSVRNLDEAYRFLELLCEEEGFATSEFEVDVDAVGDPLGDFVL